MAVTELARLRLLAGTEPSSPELLAGLAQAKEVMQQSSGFDFWFYQCVETPHVIFILGSWPSVQFHMQEFIPSQPNQDLLALLKDQITVEWMFHLDIDQSSTPLPLNRGMVAVDRHVISDGQKEAFQSTFEKSKHGLGSFIDGPNHVVGGWRIEEGYDPSLEGDEAKAEFVLFTAWDSVEHHLEFQRQEGFQNYSQIRKHTDAVDITHAKLFNVQAEVLK
ncbi:hypothetical protein H2200_007153 [Cladophialophora chaetospira]|uniref:ABM domain-containing protein n=1 Tax=Cladophialophora chaetospira TaxID=386627 RepID=A0AA38X799_9EURO|nr:hypothetical protein H2200_007153 [Cladophialophora chaetospira]